MKGDHMVIEEFPQGTAKGKPSIAEMIDKEVKRGRSPKEIITLVTTAYPELTYEEVNAAISEAAAQGGKEADADVAFANEILEFLGPVFDANPGISIGDALQILANKGDAWAIAYLARLEGPEAQAFYRDLDAAVELDPYWKKTDEGNYRFSDGATHTTAEALVAAYRQNRDGGT